MVKAREYYRRRNSKNNWYAFDTISKKVLLANFGGKNPTDQVKLGILNWFRGIKICWNKTYEPSLAFLQIACSLRLFKMIGIFV